MNLIDKNDLMFKIAKTIDYCEKNNRLRDLNMLFEFCNLIEQCPTIDPVHAAGGCYCHECKYYNGCGLCELHTTRIGGHDFCSYGAIGRNEDDE